MGTKHQRFKIDRDFMRAIRPTGAYQEFADSELRGFRVKVTPVGLATYSYRWTRPDGSMGRATVGRWPDKAPGEARDAARREAELQDRKGDTLTATVARKAKRTAVAKAAGVPTLRRYLEDTYTAHLRTYCKTHAHGDANARIIVQSFPEFLDQPLDAITGLDLEKWRTDKTGAKKRPLAKSTTNKKLTALQGLFTHAVDHEVLTAHPMAKIKMLDEPSGIVRYLDHAEAKRFYAAMIARENDLRAARDRANEHRRLRRYVELPSLRDVEFVDALRPAVLVSLMTGLRKSELFNLRWTDIDLTTHVITVRDEHAKSGKQRHIPINASLLDVLSAWRPLAHPESPYVFAGDSGAPIQCMKKSFAAVLKAARIDGFRWHDLRHTFASWLVQAGVDLYVVKELLGHATLEMTQRYAHLAPNNKLRAVTALQLGGPPTTQIAQVASAPLLAA